MTFIGCADDGCIGELRKRNVVRVAIAAIRREGDNYLRSNAPNLRDKFSDDLCRIGLVYISIDVIKKRYLMQTKIIRRALQLSGADSSDSFEAGIWSFGFEPATLRLTD